MSKEKGVIMYAFEGEVIKINERDFNNWEKAFKHIDLTTELMLLDSYWRNEQECGKNISNWFYATMCKLRYRNDKLKGAADAENQPGKNTAAHSKKNVISATFGAGRDDWAKPGSN